MKKLEIALLIGIILTVWLGSIKGFADDCSDIRANTVRLHILANSDSVSDQELKVKVRDRILADCDGLFENVDSKTDAKTAIGESEEQIKALAEDEIQKNGYDYAVEIEYVNMYFDTKQYTDYTLPAGKYDALRIKIGEAEGHNWWCVMFPPLCLPAAENVVKPGDVLSTGAMGVITSNPQVEYRFKIVEIFESICHFLFGD
ncbi:stage II sporulation protein R [Candidatus Soleaferrea massiliensis]|uniref:stage II sporulation protein R n=1 Tax=Candidatus Soleaferrea massiliensis TaxID=1470354 RepID=UPI00058CBF62|nr:stage II sporulation protein R [Candidatus Soleaferrea massiliensis]